MTVHGLLGLQFSSDSQPPSAEGRRGSPANASSSVAGTGITALSVGADPLSPVQAAVEVVGDVISGSFIIVIIIRGSSASGSVSVTRSRAPPSWPP